MRYLLYIDRCPPFHLKDFPYLNNWFEPQHLCFHNMAALTDLTRSDEDLELHILHENTEIVQLSLIRLISSFHFLFSFCKSLLC